MDDFSGGKFDRPLLNQWVHSVKEATNMKMSEKFTVKQMIKTSRQQWFTKSYGAESDPYLKTSISTWHVISALF